MMQDFATVRDLLDHAAGTWPDREMIRYFDGAMTYARFDADANAFAAWLEEKGFAKGDRLGIFAQNIPQFLIALAACWKLGGIAVPVNPMNRARELESIMTDCTPWGLVAETELIADVYDALPEGGYRPAQLVSTQATDYLGKPDPRVYAPREERVERGLDFVELLEAYRGRKAADVPLDGDDVALLVYTSGTTGKPKGTIITQGNAALGAQLSRVTQGQPDGTVSLVIAPLFHIAGIVMASCSAIHAGGTLILTYRVNLDVVLDLIAEHQPLTMSASITAYIALLQASRGRGDVLSSIRLPLSGGAAVPPAVVDEYYQHTGCRIRTGYGLTETSGGAFMEPIDQPRRLDPATGALSVGTIAPTFSVRILNDDGVEVAAGEIGEVVLTGPAVSPGYWHNQEATAEAMKPDGFHTGDVGFLDDDGWLYLVDRKKDVIIAGGYNVWPREVEDVIYSHPSISEAAVIGAIDPYRGETVKAVVSLKSGAALEPEELIAFCKERMAAYKYPRIVEIVEALPKNPAGKILKRELVAAQS